MHNALLCAHCNAQGPNATWGARPFLLSLLLPPSLNWEEIAPFSFRLCALSCQTFLRARLSTEKAILSLQLPSRVTARVSAAGSSQPRQPVVHPSSGLPGLPPSSPTRTALLRLLPPSATRWPPREGHTGTFSRQGHAIACWGSLRRPAAPHCPSFLTLCGLFSRSPRSARPGDPCVPPACASRAPPVPVPSGARGCQHPQAHPPCLPFPGTQLAPTQPRPKPERQGRG